MKLYAKGQTMNFEWSGTDKGGEARCGTIAAKSKVDAAAKVRAMGVFPDEILADGERGGDEPAPLAAQEVAASDVRHWSFADWLKVMACAVPACLLVVLAISVIPVVIGLIMSTGK